MLKGGDLGPAIVPGKPEESLLIQAVRRVRDDLQMPVGGDKLNDQQIADLVHWIEIDHEKLTYRYSGRDFRLTDVHGTVVHDILKV